MALFLVHLQSTGQDEKGNSLVSNAGLTSKHKEKRTWRRHWERPVHEGCHGFVLLPNVYCLESQFRPQLRDIRSCTACRDCLLPESLIAIEAKSGRFAANGRRPDTRSMPEAAPKQTRCDLDVLPSRSFDSGSRACRHAQNSLSRSGGCVFLWVGAPTRGRPVKFQNFVKPICFYGVSRICRTDGMPKFCWEPMTAKAGAWRSCGRRVASMTSKRFLTPTQRMIPWMWFLTVCSERFRTDAISLFVRP